MATAEKTHDAELHNDNAIKKVWQETLTTVQGRFKDAEKIWNDTFEQLNGRFHEVGHDARELVKKVEEDGRKRWDALREQLKLDGVFGKLKGQGSELMEQGAKITGDTMDRLGVATAEELQALAGTLEKLATKVETVRKRASGTPTTKAFKDLEKRVGGLEKALAALKQPAE